MGNRPRPTLPEVPTGGCIESLYASYVELCQSLSGGRFSKDPHTFAPRKFISPGLWRITEPEEIAETYERGLFRYSILQQRITIMKSQITEHFSSSPARPPVYVLRFDSPRGLAIHGFCTAVASKMFLDQVIRDDDYTWKSDYHIYVPTLELTISCSKLEEIAECTQSMTLPEPYPSLARQIRATPTHYDPPTTEQPTPKERKPKAERTPRPSTDGMTSIADIAEQLNIDPRTARQILRKLNTPKPDHGWSWADPSAIIKQIRGAL